MQLSYYIWIIKLISEFSNVVEFEYIRSVWLIVKDKARAVIGDM